MDYVDNILNDIEAAKKQTENDIANFDGSGKELVAEYREQDIECKFLNEIKDYINDDITQRYLGKHRIQDEFETNARFKTMDDFIRTLVRDSESGEIPEGHVLYIKKGYYKKLEPEMRKMFKYSQDTLLKNGSSDEKYRRNEFQGYLNTRETNEKGEDYSVGTVENTKNRIRKINILEIIARGKLINYSSNIKTKADIEEERTGEKPSRNKREKEAGFISSDDFKRISDDILNVMRKNPAKVGDTDVAILLSGHWGLRLNTDKKLTTSDLNVKDGTIEVDESKNKSEVSFIAKSFSDEKDEILSLIQQRAELLYSNNRNEHGEIPLTTCTESNFYDKFQKKLKKYGLSEKYKGVAFHGLRRMWAQNTFNELRDTMKGKTDKEQRMNTIDTVNYLLGHNETERKNVYAYLCYIY